MRYFMVISVFLLLVSGIGAQPINFNAFRMNNGKMADSNQTAFKKTLNQQFGILITGQGKTMFGTAAAVDLGASEVSFAASHVSKKQGSVFTVKGSGGVSDGFYTLFSNSTLNTNIGLEAQFHFLNQRKRMLEYDKDSGDVYNDKIAKLEYEFNIRTLEIANAADSTALALRHAKVKKTIKTLQDSLTKVTGILERKSLEIEIRKGEMLEDSIQKCLTNFPRRATASLNLRNRILENLEGLTLENGVLGFRFKWWSLTYKVNNNKFKHFIPANALSAQVIDTSFVSHAVRVQFSEYKVAAAPFSSYFWDLGAGFELRDNFSSLKKKELSETTEYGSTPGQRQATKKYNVYEGNYSRKIKGLTLYGDLYYFLFKNNVAAIHVNPEWVVQSGEKPVANFYTGLLFAVKSAKTANSVVNFELYYKFLDLFKSTETEYDLFERNNIGIRFAFPIAFKYNKID